ncbi:MAG: hypothetical protein ACRD5K_05800 [Candidatus Acidiferrales bacterium]
MHERLANDPLANELLLLGASIWVVAGILFTRLTKDVARAAPPKTNQPLRDAIKANNPRRVWREHVKQFPESTRRKAIIALAAISIALLALGMYFS